MLGSWRVVWLAAAAIAAVAPGAAQASTLPAGFTESTAISGLTQPTAVRFSPAGKVVVAEKSGIVKQFDSLSDTTPTVIANLSTAVHDFWDRGLLGLALDPNFDTNGRLYALYTYNNLGWPSTSCPDPPGANGSGCVVHGRLSMLDGGGEHVLIEDWCQQYPSHSIGSLVWGSDGKLYVSAGEGANFNTADDGQLGGNPCGDPPHEGGALRSQDLRTTGDPLGLSGTIVRLNPAQPAQREIVAYGLRNPFRITTRPGTGEIWIGDVGWNTSEEINRLAAPNAAAPVNFGWPCFEGPNPMPAYQALGDSLCQNLPSATGPYWDYAHWAHVDPLDTCPTGGSSISGMAFYPAGGSFGDAYQGALFFEDYTRNCIWVMQKGSDGLPDKAHPQVFVTAAAGPVDLQVGPDGDLFYVDMLGGRIFRIRGSASVADPTARATANKTSGAAPLTVNFNGSTSSDPRGETLTYAWDFGDGGHSTAVSPSHTYNASGVYTAQLTVTDMSGHTDTTSLQITAGTPPTVTISAPSPSTTWVVGDTINFSGSAKDFQNNPISATKLTWQVNLRHCSLANPSACHTHPLQTLTGTSGSITAPDHEYPSHLELQLTATDSNGLTNTATVPLQPKTVPITLGSQPAGADLTLGAETLTAPFTLDIIQRSRLSITAPATFAGAPFIAWSDGGARSHEIVGGSSPATYTAQFAGQGQTARLTVAPQSLAFTAIAGSSKPAPKQLTVSGPNVAVSERGKWLSVSRAGSVLTVSVNAAGLRRGAHHGTVEVSSPGLPSVDVPVKLTVKPHSTGLVGAWGFDETHGRTAKDASRPRNPGRISGAKRSNGRHGGALSFDGINDRVTVADAKALDLTYMTLEAWVRPRRGGSQGAIFTKGRTSVRGPTLRRNRWSHLAISWDGTARRLYVNGKQVATSPQAVKFRGPLRIGGDPILGKWFRGRIDDVRVYSRPLSAAEIALDRNTPVG